MRCTQMCLHLESAKTHLAANQPCDQTAETAGCVQTYSSLNGGLYQFSVEVQNAPVGQAALAQVRPEASYEASSKLTRPMHPAQAHQAPIATRWRLAHAGSTAHHMI